MGGSGWTKTKLMLFSTQVKVGVELKLELSLAKKVNEGKNDRARKLNKIGK